MIRLQFSFKYPSLLCGCLFGKLSNGYASKDLCEGRLSSLPDRVGPAIGFPFAGIAFSQANIQLCAPLYCLDYLQKCDPARQYP